MKRLLLVGYYGVGNFGDDLILETLVQALSSRFRLSAIDAGLCRSVRIDAMQESRSIERVTLYTERRRFLSKLNVLLHTMQMIWHGARHDILAFGGGTQLFETWKDGRLPLSHISKAIYILALRYLLGVKVVHIFVGVNAPKTWLGGFFLRRILLNSDFLILRDRRSHAVCRAMGVQSNRLVLATDTAYLRDVPKRLIREQFVRTDPLIVGISIFPYFTTVEGDTEGDADYLRRLLAMIRRIELETGSKPRLRFIGSHPASALDDIAYAKRIAPRFSEYEVSYFDYELDVDAYLAQLSQCDIVVGMRLHVLISAVLVGAERILALPYQTKVAEEARSWGIAELKVDSSLPAVTTPNLAELEKRKEVNEHALRALFAYLSHRPRRVPRNGKI